MRVLVVHNRYSSRVPSGENLAVDDEIRWLGEAGVQVTRHEVTNDDIVSPGAIRRVRDGLEAVWSPTAARRFAKALDDHRPDVVHVHNLFPLLTTSVPAAAIRRNVPVVWTVHNFRVRCVAGTHFRDGRPCHDCRPGFRLPGVRHRCYAESAAASALVATATSIHRSWARRHHVTAIGISRSIARWLVDAEGFEPGAVRVKYNGVAPPPNVPTPPGDQRGLLYVGRLSAEKGIELLLDAWRRTRTDAELRIVGDGPMAGAVEAVAAGDPRIVRVGQVPAQRVSELILGARALVMPSVWDEPFGRVAAEAFAHGRPVVTTGQGAAAEIVVASSGWVTGLDAPVLATALDEAATDDALVTARGAAGRARHAELFSPEATTASLLGIYRDAITAAARGGRVEETAR